MSDSEVVVGFVAHAAILSGGWGYLGFGFVIAVFFSKPAFRLAALHDASDPVLKFRRTKGDVLLYLERAKGFGFTRTGHRKQNITSRMSHLVPVFCSPAAIKGRE